MDRAYRHVFVLLCVFLDAIIYAQDCIYQDNAITGIPAGSLPPNLTEISFLQNPTTTIEVSAFDDSASTLQTLSFSLALFTRIPDAFLHLNTLKSLYIFDTNIQDWNLDAMRNIGRTVESLDLENVSITAWPTWIQYFSQLKELDLSKGSLSSMPENALDHVVNNLGSLSLFNNSLTAVPKALSKLKALKSLYLHENKIIDVTWLPQTSKLSTLSLNSNEISDANLLSHALQPYGDSVFNFDIRANQLTTIPNFTFLTQIRSLDFSNNRISDPMSGSVPSALYSMDFGNNLLPAIPRIMSTLEMVFDLSLPWNRIKEIRGTDFPPSTTGVDLAYNLISELTDTSFPQNSKIASLRLSYNPIIKISNLSFKNLPQLIDLTLQNTKLTRLPLALNSLTRLSVLDMTGNSKLVCTCMEKSLRHLFLSVPDENVWGNCGQVSIYTFFSELSPSCPSQRGIVA